MAIIHSVDLNPEDSLDNIWNHEKRLANMTTSVIWSVIFSLLAIVTQAQAKTSAVLQTYRNHTSALARSYPGLLSKTDPSVPVSWS